MSAEFGVRSEIRTPKVLYMPIIRPAEVRDAAALIEFMKANEGEPNLMNEVGDFNLTLEAERDWIKRFEDAPSSVYLVAENNGRIVGSCGCHGGTRRVDEHVGSLGIAVHPDFRGQAIGTQLLQAALDWARSRDMRRVKLTVFARNDGAIRLYERFGFEIEGRHKNAICKRGELIDTLTMAKLL